MSEKRWPQRKFLLIVAAVLVGILILFFTIASLVLEPLLKKRFHSLIINGSDSLYHYSLGSLHSDLFGANVTMKDLKIWVDSTRYRQRQMQNALPALTIGLDMKEGKLKGISLLALMIGKKLKVHEITTEEGHLTLSRHYAGAGQINKNEKPFWKAIRPSFEGVNIGQIKLDNMQFAYWDRGREDVLLQFKRCDAVLQGIKIDSAMLADTARLGYLQSLSFRLQNLDYLSADSVYKLNAGTIQYTSADKELAIEDFHLRPSTSYDHLLRLDTVGQTYFTMQTNAIRFQNVRLEEFINANTIRADSLVLQSPAVSAYFDRSAPKDMRSKVGNFPHQLIAKAPMTIAIKHLSVPDMKLEYIEKSDRTGKEGRVALHDLHLQAHNITNDTAVISIAPECTIVASGKILGSSSISARFRLYLDSANGRFDVEGSVKNIAGPQLNPLAESLANMRIQSLNIDEVLFSIKANNNSGWGNIRMRYNNLELQVLQIDKHTGDIEIKTFLSKLLNRYMSYPSNPGPDGIERTEGNVHVSRLLWHSFFGIIWKTIFAGMQNIILKP